MTLKLLQLSLEWKKTMSTWRYLPSTVIAERLRTRNSYAHSSLTWMSEIQRLRLIEATQPKLMPTSHSNHSWLEPNYQNPSLSTQAQVFMLIGSLIVTSRQQNGNPTLKSLKRSALRMNYTLIRLSRQMWRVSCAALKHITTRLRRLVSAK